nr:MAG TPA: hypothetical protein [Caudoviricetes sp.]
MSGPCCWCPRFRFGGPGASLCLPRGHPVCPSGRLWVPGDICV